MRGLVGLGDVAEAAGSTGHSQPGERAEANPAASHSVLRQAQACYYEALRTARDITAVLWMLAAAVGMASMWAESGQYETAAELLTMAVYHPACNHRTRPRASSLLSRLEAELPAAGLELVTLMVSASGLGPSASVATR